MMRLSSSCGLGAFGHAHARDGLVEHQQIRILDQQHADFEPLLLAVAEQIGVHVEPILQEDHFGDFVHPVAHGGVAGEGQRAEHRAAARIGDLQILEHREIVVDRRVLEFAADARLDDLVFLHPRQLLATELDRTRRCFGLAADQVEHGGLAGAVGTDDDTDLVLVDVEREIVDRLEPVERHGQCFDGEQEFLGLMTDEHDLSPHCQRGIGIVVTYEHDDLLTPPGRRRRPSCRSSRQVSVCATRSGDRCAAARSRPRSRRDRSGRPAPRR
ncbi:hypothetical protein ACVW0J_001601 [Bradyrhizobium sp. i1.7.7]